MIKTFILLMFVGFGGGVSAEFSSLEKCQEAINAVSEQFGGLREGDAVAVCVEK